jgi:hypothetical protein
VEKLMDGIDDYRGEEFAWAVSTALVSVNCGDCGLLDHTAEEFVEEAFEFIVGCFEGEGLEPPDKKELIEAVRKVQQAGALDWIFDNFLESGEKLCDRSITDEQWNDICRTISSAKIPPPSRSSIEKYISHRLDR